MYMSFPDLDSLLGYMRTDKEWDGAETTHRNRYPLRFVLFENFADFNEFIVNRPANVFTFPINDLLEADCPDLFPTYTELSQRIREYVKHLPANDYVIYPFSEMARFYDPREFSALVKTVKAYSPPADGQADKVRVYIPIVGMQGKMSAFMQDRHTYVWEYKSPRETGVYNLIIAPGSTYGVTGLEEKYSVVHDLHGWLELWTKGEAVRSDIICTSRTIFANAGNAQPDNAFRYTECADACQFLTKGLGLDFGIGEEPEPEELPYWEQLASLVDVGSFNFDDFVRERLNTFTLNDGVDFIKAWFDCETDFDRWLLALYFRNVSSGRGYIAKVLKNCRNLGQAELFSNIATLIFEEVNPEPYISERRKAMAFARCNGVTITDEATTKLKAKLSALAATPGTYATAVSLLTPLTDEEHQLAVEWIGRGKSKPAEIKDIFPGLYHYLQPLSLAELSGSRQWVGDYIDAYRKAKISNAADATVSEILATKNANPTAFQAWRDDFKTVRTILHGREDIDVYYWIDGLGIDWIPFIRHIVSRYEKEHVYLNEIHIASADLPTTTGQNKPKLQSLVQIGSELPKKGDLDSFAHSHKAYPQYIADEMEIVEKAITDVLDTYNGKKIAFVSDHGLTYLSQFADGMNLAGIEENHEGRAATVTGTTFGTDNNYIVLDDGKTVCALNHRSLGSKVDRGHGAHGGCTPEEVLVPVIIISSHKNANTCSVKLHNDEIEGTNPVVELTIKGLSSIDVPSIEYNGSLYNLYNIGGAEFTSDRLALVDTAKRITVLINGRPFQTFNIKVSTGASEDTDLFDF